MEDLLCPGKQTGNFRSCFPYKRAKQNIEFYLIQVKDNNSNWMRCLYLLVVPISGVVRHVLPMVRLVLVKLTR